MRASPSTRGFYPDNLTYPGIPNDLIEVSDDLYAAFRAGQSIIWSVEGVPSLGSPPVDLAAYAGAKVDSLLAAVNAYTTGDVTIHSDAVQPTLTDWMALQQWALAAPDGVTQWVANDLTVSALPAAAVQPLALLVGGYAQTVYQKLAAVLTGIAGLTITTAADIDAGFAAIDPL